MDHDAEASELEDAIANLDAIAPDDPEWEPAFKQVSDLVEAHVNEEESEFFPKAQEAIGKEQAHAMLSRYETAKKSIKSQLDAAAPRATP